MKSIHSYIVALVLVIFSIFLLAEAINSVGEFAELSFNNSPVGEPPNLPDSTNNSPIEISLDEDRVPENTTCNIGCEGGQPYDMDIFEIMGRTGTAYLRTAVGEVYNRGWKSTNQNGVPYNGEYRDQTNQFSASSEAHYFIIKPLSPLGGYIPTPKNVNQIVIDKSLIEYPSFHLFWGSATEESYEVSSIDFFFAASTLRDASCWYNETYLQEPSELKSKLKPLAEQVTGGYSSPYDKLKALESYLQTNYVYDMNYTRAPPDMDPVDWFLFHEKRGVCANFNSAFVLLARSIGIPARLVGGYLVNPYTDQQTVNTRQAHAWSEAPFVGVGWIRFDATASADSEVISKPDDGGGDGSAECETCEELFDEASETLIDVNSFISPEGCCGNSSFELFMVLGQPRTGYLRTKVGESYNGYWVPESSKVIEVDEVIPSRDIQNYVEAVAHGFIVKPLLKIGGYIPTALYASEINYGYALNYYARHESFFSPQVSNDSYRVIYTDYLFSDTVLNSSDCEYNETYLQIPSDLAEKFRPFAEEVTGNYGTPYAKLKALESYLQSNYVYDKNYTKAPSNIDPVEWFLFHERRGVCSNFNSAFVLLARSIGLPARLVAGYSVNPNLEQQTVTCSNRHAWSEVPFNGIGWIRFDATAPAGDIVENLSPLKKPTKTEITSMDVIGIRGMSFKVQGTLMDLYGIPVGGVSVVVYLNEEKYGEGIICGETESSNGVFNVTCDVPLNIPMGYFNVQAKCLGDDEYNSSWSDPVLKIMSRTTATLLAPMKVIAGREFTVDGNLTYWGVGAPMVREQCIFRYEDESVLKTTNATGFATHKITFYDVGMSEVTFSYLGSEFTLPSNRTTEIRVIPLTISPYLPGVLIRGETVELKGFVHAEDLTGDYEDVRILINGTQVASTITDAEGVFSLTYFVPADSSLGKVTLTYILDNGYKMNLEGSIKARTSLYLDYGQSGFDWVNITAKLTDDSEHPILNAQLTLNSTLIDKMKSHVLITKEDGGSTDYLDISNLKGDTVLSVKVYYPGNRHYTSAVNEIQIPIDFPDGNLVDNVFQTPYQLLLVAIIVLALSGVGFYYYRKSRTKAVLIGESGYVNEILLELENSAFRLSFPQIKKPFPLVWGVNEPLIMNIESSTPITEKLQLRYLSRVVELEPIDNRYTTTLQFSVTGTYPIELIENKGETVSRVNMRIVDYREEIIQLYKDWFNEWKEPLKSEKLTARDFMSYLLTTHPELDYSNVEKSISIFEIADYSEHDLNRGDYEEFYLNHMMIGEVGSEN